MCLPFYPPLLRWSYCQGLQVLQTNDQSLCGHDTFRAHHRGEDLQPPAVARPCGGCAGEQLRGSGEVHYCKGSRRARRGC